MVVTFVNANDYSGGIGWQPLGILSLVVSQLTDVLSVLCRNIRMYII